MCGKRCGPVVASVTVCATMSNISVVITRTACYEWLLPYTYLQSGQWLYVPDSDNSSRW
jgi:hypothetical protein